MTCLSHSHGKVYCHQRTQIVVSDKRRLRPICFVSVKKSRTQYVLLLSRGGSLPICFQYNTIEHNIKTIHIIHYKDNTHNTLKRQYNTKKIQKMRLARDGTLSNTCPLCPFCGRRIPALIPSSDTWAEFWDHFSTDLFPFEWRPKWNQNKLNFLNIEIFLPTIKNLSIKIKQIIFYSIWNTTHLSISSVRGWTEVVQIPSPNKSIEISNYWKDFLKILIILALISHSNGVQKEAKITQLFSL